MWIFTNKAMVSIVEHRQKPGTYIVRGRFKGDVAHFLGLRVAEERETPGADYRYRIEVEAPVVDRAVAMAAAAIDYPNFKDSVEDPDRRTAYQEVWTVMHRAQTMALPPARKGRGDGRG